MRYTIIDRADDNYMTVVEATTRYRLKRYAIRNKIVTGQLKAYKFKGVVLVRADELHEEMKRVGVEEVPRKVERAGRCPYCKSQNGHYTNCRGRFRKEV